MKNIKKMIISVMGAVMAAAVIATTAGATAYCDDYEYDIRERGLPNTALIGDEKLDFNGNGNGDNGNEYDYNDYEYDTRDSGRPNTALIGSDGFHF